MHTRVTKPAAARGTLCLKAAAVLAFGAALAACSPNIEPVGGATAPPDTAAAAATAGEAPARRTGAVPGAYLVKFRDSVPRATALSALSGNAFRSMRTYRSLPGLHLVRVNEGVDGQRAAAALAQRSDVEYLEPDFYVHAYAVPNDPRFPDQWGLLSPGSFGGDVGADINATPAWDITTGADNVVVAVIDSGIDYTHEDLQPNIFSNPGDCNSNGLDDDANGYVDDCHGIDTVDHDTNPMDAAGHGTHVAGILGARGNNGIGIAGVAWRVKMLPCRFLDATGEGTTSGAIECLDYIAALKAAGINVIASNNSWGNGEPSRALDDAIARQRQYGILFVAAAGNDRVDIDQAPEYPCSTDSSNVLCVAASSLDDTTFFNWGKRTALIQAPGVEIWSTIPGNLYETQSGTSMATPHVTGVVALLAAQDPSRDWRALKNLLLAGAAPHTGPRPEYNVSHLDAGGSLNCSNRMVLQRLKPLALETMIRPPGARVVFSVLNIQCAQPAGMVAVQVSPTNEAFLLRDDGTGDDQVAGDGVYTGSWTVPVAGDYALTVNGIAGEVVNIRSAAQLKPGFPVSLNIDGQAPLAAGGTGHAIAVGNIIGDELPEIVVPAVQRGPLLALHHDGTPLTGWPFRGVNLASMPAIGELDGDTTHGDLVANFVSSFSLATGIRRFTPEGLVMAGWPKSVGMSTPAIADLDADGRDDLVTYPAYRADGSRVSTVLDIPAGGLGFDPAAVADLNADGFPDVVTAASGVIWATSVNGVLPGFPAGQAHTGNNRNRAVIGDVDGDGQLEIVLAIQEFDSTQTYYTGYLGIYSNRGILERSVQLGTVTNVSEPVLGDLTADGIPEIMVCSNSRVFAIRGDGTLLPGWPFTFPDPEACSGDLLVGDLTGDGSPDVVVDAFTGMRVADGPFSSSILGTHLYVLHADATVAFGFPKEATRGTSATPAIADIDNDGRNEFLAVAPPGFGYREALFAWDYSTGPGGPVEWGQYRGGANHRGYYELGKNLPNDAYLTVHAQGAGTITGPGINCGSDCIERHAKATTVTLTATPAAGATFEGWTGGCSGMATTCTVRIDRYTSVAARFSATVTVQLSGSGAGTIVSTPAGINCPAAQCNYAFAGGSALMLVATPAAGSQFDGWSGACSGFNPQCRIALDGSAAITANFSQLPRLFITLTGDGTGTIASEPAGINCGTTCNATFPKDSQVVLTATAAPDSYAYAWTGECLYQVADGTKCTVNMDSAKTISMFFARKKQITVQFAGAGAGTVTSNPAGLTCGAQQCTMLARNGDTVQITAQPDASSEFTGWSGGCAGFALTCPVLLFNADASVTAHFEPRATLRQLQVAIAGDSGIGKVTSSTGGIDCGLSGNTCSKYLAANSTVTLTAVWGANGTFSGWGGACSGTAATCTVTMDAAKNVTATFTANGQPPPTSQPLVVTIGGDDRKGRVTSSPTGISCGQTDGRCSTNFTTSSTVVLTAAPATDGVFNGWSGDCAGTGASCTVTMDVARNVTATFVLKPPEPGVIESVRVTIAGDAGAGRVTSSPSGILCGQGPTFCTANFTANSTVVLTAEVEPGSRFNGWSGHCSGTSLTCSLTMNGSKDVTASFANNPPPPSGGSGGSGGGGGSSSGGGGGSTDLLSALGLLMLFTWRAARRRVAVDRRRASCQSDSAACAAPGV